MIRLRLLAAGLLALLSLAPAALAQQTAPPIDRSARLEKLAQELEAARQKEHVPGLALAIVQDGEVIFERGFGVKSLETQEPVTPETIFAIGSTSKAFTSALIAMLIDEGRMSWDDPVRKYLPLFELEGETRAEVTLRDLLSHRTGLTRTGVLWGGGHASREAVIRGIAKARPLAPFRQRFLYNNVQYLTAGYCSGIAAGTDWDALLEARLLEPLGMESSGTAYELLTKDPRAARGYQWDPLLEEHLHRPPRNVSSCAPAGAINSCVQDMTRWIRFQLAEGEWEGRRLLSEERFEEMRSPQIQMGSQVGYGLGWMLREWQGRKVVEHGGNIDGFAAQVTLVPEENLGYVLLANVTATTLQQGSIGLVLESLLGEEKAEADAEEAWTEDELQPYLGDYYLEAMDANLTVNIEDGKLAVNVPGQMNFALHWPNEEGRWVFRITDQIEISFAEPVDGVVQTMTLHQGGANMPAKRVDPSEKVDLGITLDEVLALARRGFGEPASDVYRIRGRLSLVHQGAAADLESISDVENRFRREVDFGPYGATSIVCDGENVWRSEFGRPVEKLVGIERLQAVTENALYLATEDWQQVFESVELLKADEVDGEPVWVVEVKPEHLPASKHYVSQETGRILASDQGILAAGIATLVMKVRNSDFREVDGLVLPFLQTVRHEQTGEIVSEIWCVEPMPSAPAGAFEPSED